MGRLSRTRIAGSLVAITAVLTAAEVSAQSPAAALQTARLTRGSITGVVSDEAGGPLGGVVVSAVGATMAMAVSDARGYFAIDGLPAGEYVIQAHLRGFAGSERERVHVGLTAAATHRFSLKRLATAPIGTAGGATPVSARPIMAAGLELPASTLADEPDPAATDGADHPHSEMAWRLRHVKRGVLRDTQRGVETGEITDDPDDGVWPGTMLWRAVDSAAGATTSLFGNLPFSGEVNLLTTSAFAPGSMLSDASLPRGVAYLAIGAPTPAGDWSVRAAMTESDVSSWIVAGAFATKPGRDHAYTLGLAYSAQDYSGGNPLALAAFTEGTRNVGEIYAFDRWTVSPRMVFEYGGQYAHYDYLDRRNLLSPRMVLTIEPLTRTRVFARMQQRMVAPGAEEFLSRAAPGPWLPPERTFAPLTGPFDAMRVERARTVGLGLEHEFANATVIGVERFFQTVDDQMVTLFGVAMDDQPASNGHYFVATAGGFDADGWVIRASTPGHSRFRGSIDYTMTRARWLSRNDKEGVAELAPSVFRADVEDLHDVTTRLEADVPETSTRVFVLYKVNSAFVRSSDVYGLPGLDGRFDLQVNQAIPLDLAGTRWELLVGVRNLFRDPNDPASVYDEVLVVRPPRRLVGGLLVRF
jgi:Carboxypeptidase regulatory-like domain